MFNWWSLRGGSIIWMRNPEWCRNLVPSMRLSMSEGSMSDFEWWWWFDDSDIRWRARVVTVRRLNRYKVIQIRRLSGIENFVSERDDFIFYIQNSWVNSCSSTRGAPPCPAISKSGGTCPRAPWSRRHCYCMLYILLVYDAKRQLKWNTIFISLKMSVADLVRFELTRITCEMPKMTFFTSVSAPPAMTFAGCSPMSRSVKPGLPPGQGYTRVYILLNHEWLSLIDVVHCSQPFCSPFRCSWWFGHIPKTRLKVGNRAFCVAGPVAWNSLPLRIRSAPKLSTFENMLKSHHSVLSFLLHWLTVSQNRLRTANIVRRPCSDSIPCYCAY